MADDGAVSQWIELVKDGDSVAARQLWQHYYEKLVRKARQRLRGQDRRVSDEEDVVISVFESFYRAAEQGRFPELAGRDDLWRLLLRMSTRKIIDKRRRSHRQRRGSGRPDISLEGSAENGAMIEVVDDEPSPDMVLSMTESVEQLMSHLGDGQLREIAVGRMEGYSNAELARRLDCSERTIERRLNLIREKCQQELLDEEE